MSYVKPHGALYNRAVVDHSAAAAIIAAMKDADRSLVLLGLPGSQMERAAADAGVQFAREAFVDRAYQSDGTLVPRSLPDAVIHDVEAAVLRAVRLVQDGVMPSIDGKEISINAQSLCVHGDNPDSKSMLAALRARLEAAGVTIRPFVA